jgi:hypothetical protein
MNQIAEDQNKDVFQRLMRARSRVYTEAVRLQVAQFISIVVLPMLGALIAIYNATSRPYVAFGALILTIIDVLWLDRAQRQKLKIAAKISEAFDCGVLRMPWNQFSAGKRVDAEAIDAAARSFNGNEQKLMDWYPKVVANAPLSLARIVCQRTNLWYDGKLRRFYGKLLVVGAFQLTLLLLVAALVVNLNMVDFVAVITTAAPVLIWAIRENFRQSDAADALEFLKGEAEALFDRAKTGLCADIECEQKSREFQDAIYNRRASNPLIFPMIYRLMRSNMEESMNAGAEALLQEANYSRQATVS